MIQSTFGSGEERGLSIQERIDAASQGMQHGSASSAAIADFLLVGLGLLVVALVALRVAARLRRGRWVAHHRRRLVAAGLHAEEIALFTELANRARPQVLPLLLRQRSAYDVAASERVAHPSTPARRCERLSALLALRRRLPFELRTQETPTFDRGTPMLLCLRGTDGREQRLEAVVLATLPHALQLALVGPLADGVAASLRTGQELLLIAGRDAVMAEARVRIRGRCMGRTLQLLVDRPPLLTSARVRIVWRGADERVRVELVERFNERLVGDSVPTVDGRVVATASDGLQLELATVRPRHGEAIRIATGAHAGFYRGYATLETSGRGGVVFVIRRSGERTETPSAPPELGRDRHEPVAGA